MDFEAFAEPAPDRDFDGAGLFEVFAEALTVVAFFADVDPVFEVDERDRPVVALVDLDALDFEVDEPADLVFEPVAFDDPAFELAGFFVVGIFLSSLC